MRTYGCAGAFVSTSSYPMKQKKLKIKIHHEGTNILVLLALMLAAVNVPAWLFLPPRSFIALFMTLLSVVVYGFVFNFFRCPARRYSGSADGMVISSVDGKVVAIEEVEESEYLCSRAIMVSVFMSPFNVHANWFPAVGKVEYVKHHRGRFLSAYLPKASKENERSTIGILCSGGCRIAVCQIAGAMARRIVTYAKKGRPACIDEHLGFIKFGSRVDIYLPLGSEIMVRIGEKTRGDLTPIARLPQQSARN